jgi:two-component system chemotaxis response regulator CheV
LPGSDAGIAGIIELRGHSIQVIDLSYIVGQPSLATGDESEASIIVTEFNRTMQGLLVRRVDEIMTIDWRDVKELPKATGASHYLSGVINIDNDLIGIVDVEKVLYELQSEPYKSAEEGVASTIPNTQGKKILVVDDSKLARSMIAQTLDEVGIDYVMASSGQDALDIINGDGVVIDMVISDIEMPQMDGYAFTRQLRSQQHTKDCYILLHSSLCGNACENMSKEVGANALLTKFASAELIREISTGLNS